MMTKPCSSKHTSQSASHKSIPRIPIPRSQTYGEWINAQIEKLESQLQGEELRKRIHHEVLTPEQFLKIVKIKKKSIVDQYAELMEIGRRKAIVELAHEVDLISYAKFRRLLRGLGEKKATATVSGGHPEWDRDARELRFRGQVIRRLRGRKIAKNVVTILDAFQKQGWRTRIDDPLPKAGKSSVRRYDAIKSLNRGLALIRFGSDGDGMGIAWRRLAVAAK